MHDDPVKLGHDTGETINEVWAQIHTVLRTRLLFISVLNYVL